MGGDEEGTSGCVAIVRKLAELSELATRSDVPVQRDEGSDGDASDEWRAVVMKARDKLERGGEDGGDGGGGSRGAEDDGEEDEGAEGDGEGEEGDDEG